MNAVTASPFARSGSDRPRAAELKTSRPKQKTLLFITRDIPATGFSRGGSNVYSRDLLLHLASAGYDVGVLLLWPVLLRKHWVRVPATIQDSPLRMVCPGYYRLFGKFWHPVGAVRKMCRKIAGLFRTPSSRPEADWRYGNPLSPEESAWASAAARQHHWDVVICNYCWLAEALSCFGPQTRKAVLTHDVWHQHLWRSSENSYLRDLDKDKERSYLGLADLVIAITTRDADLFRTMVPGKEIVVAPMSCSPRFYTTAPAPRRLLFVGSNYEANVDGVNWFLSEVAPILERESPGTFQLHVVGRVGEGLSEHSHAIPVLKKGQVLDLESEYAQAEIVVVPLCSGTGLKIKLVEAIAHGKAIVTTPAGAQGVESLAGRAFLLTDSAAEFARAVLELSDDEERRRALERGARDTAIEVFSPDQCYKPLVSKLNATLCRM